MIMRSLPLLSLTILLGVAPLTAHVEATESRELRFPPLKDGRLVLSVDTHTHSVFSRWARMAHGTSLGSQ